MAAHLKEGDPFEVPARGPIHERLGTSGELVPALDERFERDRRVRKKSVRSSEAKEQALWCNEGWGAHFDLRDAAKERKSSWSVEARGGSLERKKRGRKGGFTVTEL